MKKILFLSQVLPYPPDSGPKVKSLNVIKYLAQHYEVILASFVRGDQAADVQQLRKFCREVYTVPMERGKINDLKAMAVSLASGLPWLIARDRRKDMFSLVECLAASNEFDFVLADQLNMAQYAENVQGARKIFDAHNALWLLYKRLVKKMGFGLEKILYERDWRLLTHYEGRIGREFNAVVAVSEEDRSALEEVAGKLPGMVVVPISVDSDEVVPVERDPAGRHILHIGTMFWAPNVDGILWFAREIYPLVRAQLPQVEFDVVGARPPEDVQALGDNEPSIHVTGYVQDPSEYYRAAGVMVVPLRAGGGMRVKILNALAQGMPIVTTTLGCEGIAVQNGKHLLIADRPADFADAIMRLLNDPDFAAQLGRNGRKLIETTYDYRTACRPLDRIFEDPAFIGNRAAI
jgi:polysaccharide biosynthesis protein PslH